MAKVQRIGSYGFEGGQGRQRYYRDPLRILLEAHGHERVQSRDHETPTALGVKYVKAISPFGRLLQEALKKGDIILSD